MNREGQLGFPVPLLGMRPQRLDILLDDGELLVLAKPQGILVQADSWYPRLPVLIEAIRHQAAGQKPEFVRRNIGEAGLWAVTDLDPELHGPVLFTRTRERAEELRNALGSGNFRFTFTFLTRTTIGETERTCDLPLARHSRLPRMLVSHTTGKRCQTRFELREELGPFHYCTAETVFPRRHQILLHALETGLPVLGDTLYARQRPLFLSGMKRDYSPKKDSEERPLYDGPACFLSELRIPGGLSIEVPKPPRWTGLIRQLERHGRG